MQLQITIPGKCDHCGSSNFKIGGVSYHGPLNHTKTEVRCMRCGTLQDEVRVPR